jgi:signal transduction histidine kinase/CheY-like chemotaxis protein
VTPTPMTGDEDRVLSAAGSAAAELLSAVLELTSTVHDEELLLRRLVRTLADRLGVARVELATRDGARVRLRHTAPEPGAGRRRTPSAAVATVCRTGEPVAGVGDAEALLCMPLPGRTGVVGALLIARQGPAFSEEETVALRRTGEVAGQAIEHARLFRRVATEAEALERLAAARRAALEELRAKLTRSRWLAELGELAAGVAHDLNNSLNPILAFADLVKLHAEDPEQVRAYADRILMAARDGAETVRQVQQFTRQRRGGLEAGSALLDGVVREVVELTRPRWAERASGGPVHVVEAVEPGLLVAGTAGELRRALLNLVANALDAMPGGGTLRFVGRRDGDSILLAVQDTGTGMPLHVLQRALDPFFTTKGVKGTGLGLSEVYGIVQRRGGGVEIKSWPAVGTTILLRLRPATPAEAAAGAPAPERREARSATTSRAVLLVDDNVLSAEATAAALRSAGHRVTIAGSAEEALAHFSPGAFDLVLTDLGLPGLSGWALLDQLRAVEPGLRAGVITGWALDEDDEELRRRGLDLVFVKPVDPLDLLDQL